jgi:hypothetical protein
MTLEPSKTGSEPRRWTLTDRGYEMRTGRDVIDVDGPDIAGEGPIEVMPVSEHEQARSKWHEELYEWADMYRRRRDRHEHLREAAQCLLDWHESFVDRDMGRLPDKLNAVRAALALATTTEGTAVTTEYIAIVQQGEPIDPRYVATRDTHAEALELARVQAEELNRAQTGETVAYVGSVLEVEL